METLKGTVKKFLFRTPNTQENTYGIAVLKDDTCVVGETVVSMMPNIEYTIHGEWIQHPKYGTQLEVAYVESVVPDSQEELIKYLASGEFTGVGYRFAKKLVTFFGINDLLKRLDNNDPTILDEPVNLNKETLANLLEDWDTKKRYKEAYIYLASLGLKRSAIKSAIRLWRDDVISVIKDNPYRLMELPRVGFITADNLAIKAGVSMSDKRRIEAVILKELQDVVVAGSTSISENRLKYKVKDFLKESYSEDFFMLGKESLVNKKIVFVLPAENGDRIYLRKNAVVERRIAKKLKQMMQNKIDADFTKLGIFVEDYEKFENIKLSETQRKAIVTAVCSPVFVLTGGPGTGKTTITKAIYSFFSSIGKEIRLASPTGKAAKRMSEVIGSEAETIHRLLNYAVNDEGALGFNYNADNPLKGDVFLIDESSMIDMHLFESLVDALLPEAQLILIGDKDQLPSVTEGAVLKDILNIEEIPSVSLDFVYRQGSGSYIKTLAHSINHGDKLDLGLYKTKQSDVLWVNADTNARILKAIQQLIIKDLPDRGFKPEDIQILSPVKNKPLGSDSMNSFLQNMINPRRKTLKKEIPFYGNTVLREGDRVIQIKNDYRLNVFNGDLGYVSKIHFETDSADYDSILYEAFKDSPEYGKMLLSEDIDIVSAYLSYALENAEFGMKFGSMAVSKILPELDITSVEVEYPSMERGKTHMVSYDASSLINLRLAYSKTVHKSQGSEYKVVVLPLNLENQRYNLYRRLLYTACTRAKVLLVLVGSESSIIHASKENHDRPRETTIDFWYDMV